MAGYAADRTMERNQMRVAGIGFRASAPLSSLREVLTQVETRGGPVDALATIPQKASADVMIKLATERGVPVISTVVAGTETTTQSADQVARYGTGSVSEASALIAAGPKAVLTVPRHISKDRTATAAIAEGS